MCPYNKLQRCHLEMLRQNFVVDDIGVLMLMFFHCVTGCKQLFDLDQPQH